MALSSLNPAHRRTIIYLFLEGCVWVDSDLQGATLFLLFLKRLIPIALCQLMVSISVLSDGNRKRKHYREDDDLDLEHEFDKRLKINSESEEYDEDAIFDAEERTKKQNDISTKYSLNPSLKLKYSISKPSINRDGTGSSTIGSLGSTLSGPEVNDFIASKLYLHFHSIYISKAALVKWYNSRWLIVYHFQKWVIRLFNRFYKKYIKKIGGTGRVKLYSDFNSILDMINSESVNFQWNDLMRILNEENYLEGIRLQKKAISRTEKEQLKRVLADKIIEDHSYSYWDRLKGIDKDVNMFDGDVGQDSTSCTKLEELLDLDMEIE